MQEIDIESALKTNILRLGTMTLEAFDDRVIVVEDVFRSGYECSTCNGDMNFGDLSHIVCEDCSGTGKIGIKKCSGCSGEGRIVCPTCKGKGGVIIIPDDSKRRPTTGQIVSIGDKVTRVEKGVSVLYDSFVGNVMDLSATDIHGKKFELVIRIIRESEIQAKITGHLELRKTVNQGVAA